MVATALLFSEQCSCCRKTIITINKNGRKTVYYILAARSFRGEKQAPYIISWYVYASALCRAASIVSFPIDLMIRRKLLPACGCVPRHTCGRVRAQGGVMGASGSRRHLQAVPFDLDLQGNNFRNLRDTKVRVTERRDCALFRNVYRD